MNESLHLILCATWLFWLVDHWQCDDAFRASFPSTLNVSHFLSLPAMVAYLPPKLPIVFEHSTKPTVCMYLLVVFCWHSEQTDWYGSSADMQNTAVWRLCLFTQFLQINNKRHIQLGHTGLASELNNSSNTFIHTVPVCHHYILRNASQLHTV